MSEDCGVSCVVTHILPLNLSLLIFFFSALNIVGYKGDKFEMPSQLEMHCTRNFVRSFFCQQHVWWPNEGSLHLWFIISQWQCWVRNVFCVNGSFHGVFDQSDAWSLLRIVAIVLNSDITTIPHDHGIYAPKLSTWGPISCSIVVPGPNYCVLSGGIKEREREREKP